MTVVAFLLGAWIAISVGWVVALVGRRVAGGRTEALARACHELRGPLTAMRLGLELASRAGGGLSTAQLRALDLELGRAALALDDLAVAGSPAGRPGVRPASCVDAADLLADSAEAWRPVAAAAGARLQVSWSGAPASVNGDRPRLAQATGNLIANAIEHGGGTIELRGRGTGGSVRIEVIDDGPGLPAPVAVLARRARKGRASRGRGLAIASSVARDHGGRLAAAPSERGARLVLELPFAEGSGQAGFEGGPPA